MRGGLVPLLICVILTVSLISEGKRSASGSRKSGSNIGSAFSLRRNKNQPTQNKKQDNQPRRNSSSSTFGGGNHGSTNTHFLDSERQNTNANKPPIGFEHFGNPSQGNRGGIGFDNVNHGNYKPSAPPGGGNQGLGSAFGGANYPPKTQTGHVQSAPYPTGNNPFGHQNSGFGQPNSGFGQPNSGFGQHNTGFGQPNSGIGQHNSGFGQPNSGFGQPNSGFGQPNAGFGQHSPGFGQQNPGFGSGTHYNQPNTGFGGSHQPAGGFGGTNYQQQPNYGGGFGGNRYPQPGYGQAGGYNQHGGGFPSGHGGYNPGGYGGYNPGGYGGGYGGNPGGFGGGYGGYNQGYGHQSGGFGGFGHGGGYPQSGGFYPGGYKQKSSGPGFGMGLLGGGAAALPLGLLLGYGLGSSMGSMGSMGSLGSSNLQPNNDAFNAWLKQRTEEQAKANATTTSSGETALVNKTEIMQRILNETQMCPGGAGILDASFLNTLVPCNITDVDFQQENLTEPYEDDCKSLTLELFQLNTATKENKTLTMRIKQNNVTGADVYETLTYDIDLVSCVIPVNNPEGRSCETRAYTALSHEILNVTSTYLHTANVSLTQYNTTLNVNNSCAEAGACGPDSKPPRNITSTLINFSVLPLYPANIMMSQCIIFKTNTCDPSSSTPCDTPLVTTKQSIKTNTTLSSSDFANINFVLHQSRDIFQAFTPPPQPPQQEIGEQPGSTSNLSGTSTPSSATTI